jgi:hypothetical protein
LLAPFDEQHSVISNLLFVKEQEVTVGINFILSAMSPHFKGPYPEEIIFSGSMSDCPSGQKSQTPGEEEA